MDDTHTLNAPTPIDYLRKEVEWCQDHRGISKRSDDFEIGFIMGLEQAILILEQLEKFGSCQHA